MTNQFTYDIICIEGAIIFMNKNKSFNQTEYISNFNKNNYKMYQFRVKKSDVNIINHLDNIENRNGYIVSLINTDINNSIYTIKEIKNIIKPILNKYGINDIYLFGSYARGDAKETSDIDIYCNKGNIKTFIDQGLLEDELKYSSIKDESNMISTFLFKASSNSSSSDIDIYCNKGNIKTFIDQGLLEDELEEALNKKVDIIFDSSFIDEYFKKQIMEDMIKLC